MIEEVYGNGHGLVNSINAIQLMNFDSFINFFIFFNELIDCTINKTMVENLINKFFNNFLLEIIQPILLTSEDSIITRTCIQYLVHMVHFCNSSKILTIIFFFLFGFPEGSQPIEEEDKQEIEYEHINQEEHKHEDIDDMFNFMNNDELLLHKGEINDKDIFELDENFIIPMDPVKEIDQEIDIPMIRIGNKMMAGPQKNEQPVLESRGRVRTK